MITLEEPFGRKFSTLAKSYLEVLTEKLKGIDLDRYFFPLGLIANAQDDPLTQQQLADLLEVDKVTVLRIVNYLYDKGYIVREKYAEDKRAHRLVITPKGRKDIRLVNTAISELNSVIFKGFEEKDIGKFWKVFEGVQYNLRKMPSSKVRVNYKKINKQQDK